MHTENVASTDLIRAAVVAQLAKPSAPLSPFWQVTSTFKYQVLTWVGIVGTSITIFANLEGILLLSDLAKKVIIHWHEWTQAFWGWVFSLIKVEVEREYVPFISFTVFIVILVVGVNLSVRTGKTPGESQNATPLWGKFRIFVLGLLLYLGGLVLLIFVATAFAPANVYAQWALIFIFTICVPTSYQLYFLKERMWFFIASLLFLVMVGCLLVAPIVAQDTEVGAFLLVDVFFVFVFQIFWMAVTLLSSATAVDATSGVRRGGSAHAPSVKRDFKTQFASICKSPEGVGKFWRLASIVTLQHAEVADHQSRIERREMFGLGAAIKTIA